MFRKLDLFQSSGEGGGEDTYSVGPLCVIHYRQNRLVSGLLLRMTVILKMIKVSRIFSNFPAFVKHNSLLFCSGASPLDLSRSQMNPIFILILNLCKVQFNPLMSSVPPVSIYKFSAFCPQSVFVCSEWVSQ
jgi:hypothetical protein